MDLKAARHLLCSAALPLLAVAGGCQSYSPIPLDRATHHEAFLQRTPSEPEVAAFAERLANADSLPPFAFDPSDGLSIAEAEVVALVYNGELRLARLRAGVSAAGAQYAGLWEDPVFSTDLARIIQSTEHPWKIFTSFGFTIPLSGRLEVEKKRATDAHRADVVRAWAQEWTIRIELRRRWIEWSSARERAEVMRLFLESLDPIVGIVDRMARAGEMSRVESRLFEVERVSRATELAALEVEAARAELVLKNLLGLAPTTSVVFIPTLSIQGGDETTESHGGAPRDSNTQLAIARAEYEVAERTLELEIRRQYPDLTIGPGYGREEGQDQFLLGISIPLPILNRNRQSIAIATSEREVARAVYETTHEQIVNGLAGAVLAQQAATQQRQIMESSVVPLVDEQYADARRIAELGEVNTIVLLESLTRQQEAKLRLIDARAAESLAQIEIDELVGPPVEPNLNEGANR